MDSHRQSNANFWIISGIVLVLAAAAVAALWPEALSLAHSTSNRLTSDAQKNRGMATADYQLAVWLDSGNQSARLGLAAQQIANGQSSQALATLKPVGEGNEAETLRLRASLETNQPDAAVATADQLTAQAPTDANIELAALAYAYAGRPLAIDSSLISHLTSPEALQIVGRAGAGQITLAGQLYATGLLHSSQRILLTLPQSYERNLLLAQVDYDIHSKSTLAQAAGLLTATTTMSPADVTNRQLLVQIYQAQGQPAQASNQTSAIAKLDSGRP